MVSMAFEIEATTSYHRYRAPFCTVVVILPNLELLFQCRKGCDEIGVIDDHGSSFGLRVHRTDTLTRFPKYDSPPERGGGRGEADELYGGKNTTAAHPAPRCGHQLLDLRSVEKVVAIFARIVATDTPRELNATSAPCVAVGPRDLKTRLADVDIQCNLTYWGVSAKNLDLQFRQGFAEVGCTARHGIGGLHADAPTFASKRSATTVGKCDLPAS